MMAKAELAHRGYSGSVDISLEDDCLHGRVQFINDLITYEGNTIPELRSAFAAAVDRYLEHCGKVGKSPDKPYSGTFNVRVPVELHRCAAQAAQRAGISLNEYVTDAIDALVAGSAGAKVEHVHNHRHETTVVMPGESTMRIATASKQATWEQTIGTQH